MSNNCLSNFPPEISLTDWPKIGSPMDLRAWASSSTLTFFGTRPATI